MVLNEASIIRENTDLVRAIASKYKSYGVPAEDLEQEGRIGLLLAARMWRPDGGASLRTYAAQRIAVHIRRAIGVDSKGKMSPTRKHSSLDAEREDDLTLYDVLPSASRTPEEIANSNQEAAMLASAIKELSEEEREVLLAAMADERPKFPRGVCKSCARPLTKSVGAGAPRTTCGPKCRGAARIFREKSKAEETGASRNSRLQTRKEVFEKLRSGMKASARVAA